MTSSPRPPITLASISSTRQTILRNAGVELGKRDYMGKA